MAFNVNDFRAQMIGDGARPNLFEVSFTFPSFVAGNSEASRLITFMGKASALPASTVNSITVPYFGRELKFAGSRQFQPFNVTVINDENFIVRNALERWLSGLNSHVANRRNPNALTPESYTATMSLKQYAKDGTIAKSYNFVGAFPTQVGEIAVAWDDNDRFEEFDVTFDYQWWESNTTDRVRS